MAIDKEKVLRALIEKTCLSSLPLFMEGEGEDCTEVALNYAEIEGDTVEMSIIRWSQPWRTDQKRIEEVKFVLKLEEADGS